MHLPLGPSKMIQIIIQNRYRDAKRRDESPEDPEIMGDEDVVALAIKVEKLRAEHSLALTSALLRSSLLRKTGIPQWLPQGGKSS